MVAGKSAFRGDTAGAADQGYIGLTTAANFCIIQICQHNF